MPLCLLLPQLLKHCHTFFVIGRQPLPAQGLLLFRGCRLESMKVITHRCLLTPRECQEFLPTPTQ